jgi:lysophospholipase L1-like esterase
MSWVGLAAPAAVGTSASRIAVIGDSYTAGSDEGGNGSRAWPELVRGLLALEGVDIDADIAAEGGAGYGQRGDGGSVFEDLTARAVRRSDAPIVFFGSRNDQPVDPQKFPAFAADTVQLDLIGQDGVHPTDAGHAYMAAKIAPLNYAQLTIRV